MGDSWWRTIGARTEHRVHVRCRTTTTKGPTHPRWLDRLDSALLLRIVCSIVIDWCVVIDRHGIDWTRVCRQPRCLSAGYDGGVRAWSTASGSCLWSHVAHTRPIKSVTIIRSGSWFVSASLVLGRWSLAIVWSSRDRRHRQHDRVPHGLDGSSNRSMACHDLRQDRRCRVEEDQATRGDARAWIHWPHGFGRVGRCEPAKDEGTFHARRLRATTLTRQRLTRATPWLH